MSLGRSKAQSAMIRLESSDSRKSTCLSSVRLPNLKLSTSGSSTLTMRSSTESEALECLTRNTVESSAWPRSKWMRKASFMMMTFLTDKVKRLPYDFEPEEAVEPPLANRKLFSILMGRSELNQKGYITFGNYQEEGRPVTGQYYYNETRGQLVSHRISGSF